MGLPPLPPVTISTSGRQLLLAVPQVVTNVFLTGVLLRQAIPCTDHEASRMCQIQASVMLWITYYMPGSCTHNLSFNYQKIGRAHV